MRDAQILILSLFSSGNFMSTTSTRINSEVFGYLSAVCATIIWAGNFAIARGAVDVIPPVALAFWRWVVALLILIPFALPSLMREWGVVKKHLPYLSICGFFGVTLFNTLIYVAGHSTAALNLSLIAITFPVFVVLISRWIDKEAISLNKASGILIVVLGILTLISRGKLQGIVNLKFALGDLWMLIAALGFAIYSVLVKKKPASIGMWSFLLSTFVLGLLILTPFYIWELGYSKSFQFDIPVIGSVLYLGVFASFAAYIFWNRAVVNIGPTKASMVYYSLPLFSGVLSTIFLGEVIETFHLVCGVLIVSGILIASYVPSKK